VVDGSRCTGVGQVKESESVIWVTALASRTSAANGWSLRSWLSALGTLKSATNGFGLALNWTAGKLPVVAGGNGSFADLHFRWCEIARVTFLNRNGWLYWPEYARQCDRGTWAAQVVFFCNH
jgi:hypothetical protein